MGDTVQKKTQEPWQPTQEPWKQLIGRAGELFGQNPDPTAVNALHDALNQNASLASRSEASYANLYGDTWGTYRDLLDGMKGPGANQQYLTAIASGQSGVNSPDFQQALNYQTDLAANSLKDRYAAAGRSFSGAEAGDWARNIGGIRAQTLAEQFNKDRAAQLQAAGQISGEQINRQGLLANTVANRASALSGILGNRYGLLSSLLSQRGGLATALQGAQDQLKWGDARNYAGILQSPNGGTTTEPGPNRLLQILGAIGGIGGLFGGLMSNNSTHSYAAGY